MAEDLISDSPDSCVERHCEPILTTNKLKSADPCLAPVVGKISSWLADTGASVDALDGDRVSKEGKKFITNLDFATTYETAGGTITVDESVKLHSNMIGEIDAVLLKDAPSVISVGKRCMDLGYDFHWPAFKPPIITFPDGVTKVNCVVENYCPYVVEDEGVVCPLKTSDDNPSSSSSSRVKSRDESHLQPAMEKP